MKVVWGVLLGLDILAVNLATGYLIYKSQTPSPKPQTNLASQITNTEYVDRCGEECQAFIEQKLASRSATVKPTPTPIKSGAVAVPTPKKTRSVQYVAVPGNGSTNANIWTNLVGSDFYFDTKDYPGLVEIYFEASIKLFNGNGRADVQLFDATHGIGVQGSDISTTSQTDTVVTSGKVTFWAGKNLIRVQLKSLTADTTVFNWGRLRIVTEN